MTQREREKLDELYRFGWIVAIWMFALTIYVVMQ